jgi:hypothetical protein
MTTPSGLLMWGQAGAYDAINDRLVIAAVTGKRTGLVGWVTATAGSGLQITVKGGWLGIAACGDGTSAVVGSTTDQVVTCNPGPASGSRTDYIWCDVQPDQGTWSLTVVDASTVGSRTGLPLVTLTVPANATLATQMTIAPYPPTLEKRLLASAATTDTNTRTATAWGGATTVITAVATCLPGHYYRVRAITDSFMGVAAGSLDARGGIGYRAAGAADATSTLMRSTCIALPAINRPTMLAVEYVFGHPAAGAPVARNFDARYWIASGSFRVCGRTDQGAALSISVEDMGQ